MDVTFWMGAFATVMAIAGTHYFVTRYGLWNSGISLVGRYTVGTLSYLIPFNIWCIASGHTDALVAVDGMALAAGAMTLILYLLDGALAKNIAETDTAEVVKLYKGTPQ